MKASHLLLLSALAISACSPATEQTSTVKDVDETKVAAKRIDAGLMHDYDLTNEQRTKRKSAALPPLPQQADDTTFLRRACIDLAGRLPKPDEVRSFIGDKTTDKRARLTNALIKEPGAAEVRFRMLAEAFRVNDDAEVIAWLHKAATDDMPFAQILTHMIGEGHLNRRDQGNAMRTGVEVAYSVLGEDLYCAMCHDHAYNSHTQREAHAFAACFKENGEVRLPKDYCYRDGKPGEVVKPKLLPLNREKAPLVVPNQDQLLQVAEWIISEPSHRFATVTSLRVWSSLFGMPGLLEDHTTGGVDVAPAWHEIHAKPIPSNISSNCFGAYNRSQLTWLDSDFHQPSDNSKSVKTLTEEFLRCGGRIGEFQRILADTAAYHRAGIDYNTDWNGCYMTPAPHIRRLPSEVIWDALATRMSGQKMSAELPQVPTAGHPLRLLGRGTREWTDESVTPVSHELARFMMNSGSVQNACASAGNVEALFLSLIGRLPSAAEQARAQRHVAESPQTFGQDIAWALLNTTEFLFRP